MSDLAESFKKALHTVEQEKSPDAIMKFFGEGARLERLSKDHSYEGEEGARRFWTQYSETFKTQKTTFNETLEGEGFVVLEWTSEGELPNGESFSYRGVSVLEGEGEQVRAFRTYYDSAAFINEEALA